MKITVMLFANLKDIAGKGSIELELPDGASVKELKAAVSGISEKLGEVISKGTILVALNQEMALDSDKLKDGDEVGLLPPFSGG